MNAPLTTSGSFDPLAPAGGGIRTTTTASTTFKPGQFVRASIDNTAFFSKRPKGDADADKLLARDTNMKVISSDSSYVKVELDSGEVGFVPAVMVNDPNAPLVGPADGNSGIYPPIDGTGAVEPLPTFDTSGLPPADSVPPIIDPTTGAPMPAVTDPGAVAPVQVAPAPAPAPGTAPATPATTPAAAPSPAPAPAPKTTTPLPPGIDDKPAGQ